jgi:hypothetical protein
MAFCEHCEGQRFDRARVLRALRQVRKQLSGGDDEAQAAIALALRAIRRLDIPHLEVIEDTSGVVH